MRRKFFGAELAVRGSFIGLGILDVVVGFDLALPGSFAAKESWRRMLGDPPAALLIAFVGGILLYFGLRKKSILKTLQGGR